jgi:hypothetical protein
LWHGFEFYPTTLIVHPREEVEQKLKAIAKSLINLGFLIEPKEGDRSPLDAHFSGDFHRVSLAMASKALRCADVL